MRSIRTIWSSAVAGRSVPWPDRNRLLLQKLERGKIKMIIFCSNLLLQALLFLNGSTGESGGLKCLRRDQLMKANNVAAVVCCFHHLSSPNNHKPSKRQALSSSSLQVCAWSLRVQSSVGTEGREGVSFSCSAEWHQLQGKMKKHNVNVSPRPFAWRTFWSIPQFAFFQESSRCLRFPKTYMIRHNL